MLDDILNAVREKIAEREALYAGTWTKIRTEDLIAVARVKTHRATTLLNSSEKAKLEDDLIDAIAYLVFALVKVKGGEEK